MVQTPRKRLLKRAAAEGVNDRYIIPQKYRDKMANVTTYSSLLLLAEVRGWLSVNEQAIFKVDDLEEFNKYPWEEVTFDRAIAKLKSPLLYQANKKNSDAGGEPTYKVLGLAHALVYIGWQPHMLCVLCTRSPNYPPLIRTLEVDDVHVLPDVMWHKGDGNQLKVLGLEEGTPEEREDRNQGHEVPETAPVFLSKKRKASMEESHPCEGEEICNYESEHLYSSEPMTVPSQESVSRENENNIHHTNVKDSHGKDVHKRNTSSCSGARTTEIELLEVGELVGEPVDATINTSSSKGLTCDSSLVYNGLKIPEEYLILNKKICEKYGHMATRKLIKFNDAMLLACVTSLLKIISAMENVRGSELSEALLDRWEGSIKDAEALEFNVRWLREGFNRIKNHWRSNMIASRQENANLELNFPR
ncbi:hypothetical protein MKX03_003424 [Papaver bracteatum]|nr:hypothetical protein MKX03_003424 [Papaver bracteatum]